VDPRTGWHQSDELRGAESHGGGRTGAGGLTWKDGKWQREMRLGCKAEWNAGQRIGQLAGRCLSAWGEKRHARRLGSNEHRSSFDGVLVESNAR
jgi:hypothetical protein